MPWKLRIWIAGLFVASLSWTPLLVTFVYPTFYHIEEDLLTIDNYLIMASVLFIIPGIVAGISFAFMKFRKEKAVTALWIWTFWFILSSLVMLNV